MLKSIKERFFNHTLQESLNLSTITITFVKLANKWYADIPSWKGSVNSLQMVGGCDDFLEDICKNGRYVTLKISTEEQLGGWRAHLKHLDAFGGTYTLNHEDIPQIWICNVTKYVFGDHPQHLYFSQMA